MKITLFTITTLLLLFNCSNNEQPCKDENCLTDAQLAFFSGHIASITTKKQLFEATTLDLSNKSITSLDTGIFNNLTNLNSVDLTDNTICIVDKADVGLADSVTLTFDGWNCLTNEQLTFFSDHIMSITTKQELYEAPSLNLQSKRITSLDTGIFNNLTKLNSVDLTDNDICIVDKADVGLADGVNLTFGNYCNLVTNDQLTFFKMHITDITKKKLFEATTLDLSNKSITSLDTGIFNNLTNLNSVNLTGNYTCIVDKAAVGLADSVALTLPPLNEDCLTDDQLDFFNSHIPSITTKLELYEATNLNLSHKSISTLPTGIFNNLTNLRSLDLRTNALTSLPDGIDKLTSLTELYLSQNNLTSIPDGIDKLTSLRELYLSGNDLTSLPDGIDKLTSLTTLRSNNNQLTSIPDGIDKLTNLFSLDLSGNDLTSIPDGIDKLTNLRSLDLSGNDLTSIPDGIDKLTSLRALLLDNNDLASLPDGIFNNLTSLTSLQLKRSVDTNSFDCNDTNYTAWGLTDPTTTITNFTCN